MTIATSTLKQAMEAARTERTSFIADKVFPPVTGVPGTEIGSAQGEGTVYSFSYYKHGANNNRGAGELSLRRGERQPPTVIPSTLEDATGTAKEYAARSSLDITKRSALQAKGVRSWAQDVATPAVTHALMIEREKRVLVDNLQSSSLFANGVTGAAANYWDTATNNPINTLYTAVGSIETNSGKQPNTFVLSQDHFVAFRDNPNVREYFGDVRTAIPPAEAGRMLREALLHADPNLSSVMATDFMVLVSQATRRTSNLAQTDAYDYIFDNYAWMGYVERQSPSLLRYSAGYCVEIVSPESEIIEDRPNYAIHLDAREVVGEIVPNGGAGYRFNGMVENPKF